MRKWSAHTAFKDYLDDLDGLETDIQEWMKDRSHSYEYARKVHEDSEWEHWDMSVDLDGWIEDIAFEHEVDYDYLRTRANILLTEDVFRTLEFDETSKTLN